VEQLVDAEQLMALGYMVNYANKHLIDGKRTMGQIVDLLMKQIERDGLKAVCEGNYIPSGLAIPRKQEIFACFNRYRKMDI
jgi:hypothetical protein